MTDYGALKHPAGPAHNHPAYDDALRRAAQRAYESRGEGTGQKVYSPPCFSVWFDGEAIYVRASEAAPPLNATLVCIAQHFTKGTVQLRFTGARSEWVEFE